MNDRGSAEGTRVGGSLTATLAEIATIEARIAEAAGAARAVVVDHGEAAEALAAVGRAAVARRKALEDRLAMLDTAGGAANGPARRSPDALSASETLRQVAGLLLDAALGYEAAYLAGRFAFDYDTCNLLEGQLADCVTSLAMVGRALPHVVARELADSGAVCGCRCPMCSIGLCGCLRATLAVTELGWTGREPPPARGLVLQGRPRPGSQLAEVGLAEGDRILTADGEPVGTNDDVQAALRRRDVGQEVRLEVERISGERMEIRVRRVA